MKISRNEFEDICKELFDKIVQITKKTINDSPIPVEDILDYVLVGGSSNIPKIENILYDIFKFEPHKTSNNELAVASGAAIYGAFRGKFIDSNYSNIKINNITSLSYGLELDNGEMDIIIPKNSKIPFEKTEKYKTADDNQTKAKIIIYQGENFYTEDNTFIDEYTIPNLIPKPKGEIVFDVTFKINENGILTVKSVESGEGQINKLKFNTNNGLNEEIFKENINRDSVNYKKINITCLSYGLELDNGEMNIIIPKNSRIPFEKTQKYQTAEDNQTKAKIIVYQGENFYTKDNTFIDEYTIANITTKTKGNITFDVTFKINQNGI